MDVREKLVDVFTHLGEHIRNGDEYGICYTSDFTEAVEEVLKMLKNSVTVQEWISVEDRLPEAGAGEVLVIKNFRGKQYVDVGEIIEGKAYCYSDEHAIHPREHKLTHWMPLPAPPGGDT